MSFRKFLDDFILQLDIPANLPDNVKLLYPFDHDDVQNVCRAFYQKYYNDDHKRTMLLGINPGRFGAGLTGIPFTDPIRLHDECGIPNNFNQRPELSSVFIYDIIKAYGGPEVFYGNFIFSSVSPFGFVRDDKNLNYYDVPALQQMLEVFNVECLKKQIEMGINREVAISVGKGKNFKYLKKLNEQHKLFGKIEAIPHPRWVMQYRLKQKDQFIAQIIDKLKENSLISHG